MNWVDLLKRLCPACGKDLVSNNLILDLQLKCSDAKCGFLIHGGELPAVFSRLAMPQKKKKVEVVEENFVDLNNLGHEVVSEELRGE